MSAGVAGTTSFRPNPSHTTLRDVTLDSIVGRRLDSHEQDSLADYLAAFVNDPEVIVTGSNPSRRHYLATLLAKALGVDGPTGGG
jgi:hypothetical protein